MKQGNKQPFTIYTGFGVLCTDMWMKIFHYCSFDTLDNISVTSRPMFNLLNDPKKHFLQCRYLFYSTLKSEVELMTSGLLKICQADISPDEFDSGRDAGFHNFHWERYMREGEVDYIYVRNGTLQLKIALKVSRFMGYASQNFYLAFIHSSSDLFDDFYRRAVYRVAYVYKNMHLYNFVMNTNPARKDTELSVPGCKDLSIEDRSFEELDRICALLEKTMVLKRDF